MAIGMCSLISGWTFAASYSVRRKNRFSNICPKKPSSAEGTKSSAPDFSPSLTQICSMGQPLPESASPKPNAVSIFMLALEIADVRPSKSVASIACGSA